MHTRNQPQLAHAVKCEKCTVPFGAVQSSHAISIFQGFGCDELNYKTSGKSYIRVVPCNIKVEKEMFSVAAVCVKCGSIAVMKKYIVNAMLREIFTMVYDLAYYKI